MACHLPPAHAHPTRGTVPHSRVAAYGRSPLFNLILLTWVKNGTVPRAEHASVI